MSSTWESGICVAYSEAYWTLQNQNLVNTPEYSSQASVARSGTRPPRVSKAILEANNFQDLPLSCDKCQRMTKDTEQRTKKNPGCFMMKAKPVTRPDQKRKYFGSCLSRQQVEATSL